ncbi:uncharacterized protein MONOS_15650 [Monocercomonoides exilis]|uniref:uncharacterized protein n=1 Tax=Monocercomonoides exilis TaxID=2049356 RepID=UPI00355A3B79|nr:hypothetical protein MONOS_15650 [Monocercomonoides exilis]|eukprot:MONOS_15650.1-p1 / transcript=MONOS_15650.1 / gene=MONOS_15650 / organism=Monocercomonoides_exilis_PA203 / gene_product=unspecified product / transcript_product=unspecified product / location=Mono_scaffold01297:5400-6188(-) / protein_length=263 / sequence_SO=supercontig / SO=protein_coding / is_pseudo=false
MIKTAKKEIQRWMNPFSAKGAERQKSQSIMKQSLSVKQTVLQHLAQQLHQKKSSVPYPKPKKVSAKEDKRKRPFQNISTQAEHPNSSFSLSVMTEEDIYLMMDVKFKQLFQQLKLSILNAERKKLDKKEEERCSCEGDMEEHCADGADIKEHHIGGGVLEEECVVGGESEEHFNRGRTVEEHHIGKGGLVEHDSVCGDLEEECTACAHMEEQNQGGRKMEELHIEGKDVEVQCSIGKEVEEHKKIRGKMEGTKCSFIEMEED